jgi:dipeptidase E
MRLYLSSYQIGNKPEELAKLVRDNKKVAVIMNAVDFGDAERVKVSYESQCDSLKKIGLQPSQLDLRKYFGKEDELRSELKKFGAVWIHGGNVFVLQRAFEQSGFGEIIKDMVAQDQIVYAGFSAAVCLAAPTLQGAELVDDPDIIPEGYKPDFDWDGLGLIDYNVAVHYQSDHPESDDVEKEVIYYKDNMILYKTLRDGEVIIIDGDDEKLVK